MFGFGSRLDPAEAESPHSTVRHRISTGSMPYSGLTPSPPLDGSTGKFAYPNPSAISYPTSRDSPQLKKTPHPKVMVSEKDAHKQARATKSDSTYRKR